MEELKIELKHIAILVLIIFTIAYISAIRDYNIKTKDRMSKVEKYLNTKDLQIGNVKISDDYSLKQARRDYSYFTRFGSFNTTVNTILDDICG
jgi:hypothetical protein